jgi:hypothetical protein
MYGMHGLEPWECQADSEGQLVQLSAQLLTPLRRLRA